jgi:selenium metabolism protein YedF
MVKEVDARGYPCPQPVLMTKEAVEKGAEELIVFVDNKGAAENVARFAEKSGYKAHIEKEGSDFKLHLSKVLEEEKKVAEVICESEKEKLLKGKVLLISTDSIGRGSEELGRILVKALLNTLSENDLLPEKIALINSGVKLACEGSDVVEALQRISKEGVEILVCGTCLNYFNLTEEVKAGKVSNAYEILNTLLEGNVLSWS